jgi:hypothetical protein
MREDADNIFAGVLCGFWYELYVFWEDKSASSGAGTDDKRVKVKGDATTRRM